MIKSFVLHLAFCNLEQYFNEFEKLRMKEHYPPNTPLEDIKVYRLDQDKGSKETTIVVWTKA